MWTKKCFFHHRKLAVFLAVSFFTLQLNAKAIKENISILQKKYYIQVYDYPVVFNLDNAIEKLNKLQIPAGQSFSFNKTLGSRKSGYKKAKTYFADGSVIYEEGGGLCMLSSILYHLYLEAGFKIIERHPHIRPVSYALPGYDAAISYGHKDLVIKNTSAYAAEIHLKREGRILTARLRHRKKLGYKILLSRDVKSRTLTNRMIIEIRRSYFYNEDLKKEEIISRDIFKTEDIGHSRNKKPHGRTA